MNNSCVPVTKTRKREKTRGKKQRRESRLQIIIIIPCHHVLKFEILIFLGEFFDVFLTLQIHLKNAWTPYWVSHIYICWHLVEFMAPYGVARSSLSAVAGSVEIGVCVCVWCVFVCLCISTSMSASDCEGVCVFAEFFLFVLGDAMLCEGGTAALKLMGMGHFQLSFYDALAQSRRRAWLVSASRYYSRNWFSLPIFPSIPALIDSERMIESLFLDSMKSVFPPAEPQL